MQNFIFSMYAVLFILFLMLTTRLFAYGLGNLFHLLLLGSAIVFSWGWVVETDIV